MTPELQLCARSIPRVLLKVEQHHETPAGGLDHVELNDERPDFEQDAVPTDEHQPTPHHRFGVQPGNQDKTVAWQLGPTD
jgi:hypothetical protein